MHAAHELPRQTWGPYFDGVSQELFNAEVAIEIIEAAGTKRPQLAGLALQALTYDRRDDVFEVAAARGTAHLPSVVRHVVDQPERIAIDGSNGIAPTLIAIDDRGGIRTLVRISRPADLSG